MLELKLDYQLAGLIPGNSPFRAASLNAIRDKPMKRYTPRGLPVNVHRFRIRVIEPCGDN